MDKFLQTQYNSNRHLFGYAYLYLYTFLVFFLLHCALSCAVYCNLSCLCICYFCGSALLQSARSVCVASERFFDCFCYYALIMSYGEFRVILTSSGLEILTFAMSTFSTRFEFSTNFFPWFLRRNATKRRYRYFDLVTLTLT